jgi:transposase
MMVALLLYAYVRGNRSSRAIERACAEDVAYRVAAGNLVPDHSTIAEFRMRHEDALAELFTAVLGLCWWAGLVSVGWSRSMGRRRGERLAGGQPRL